MTDVTGFGLLGHAMELARGARKTLRLDMSRIPLLAGAAELAAAGFVTGASARNWAGYGEQVELGAALSPAQRALLTDPQTSGGLLVSCSPESVDAVLEIFRAGGFAQAAEIGEVLDGPARVEVR